MHKIFHESFSLLAGTAEEFSTKVRMYFLTELNFGMHAVNRYKYIYHIEGRYDKSNAFPCG